MFLAERGALMQESVRRRVKRRPDVLITFFAALATILIAGVLPLRDEGVADPITSVNVRFAGTRIALGAIAVAALSFSATVFSIFYAVYMLRNRRRQPEIKPLLTPAEMVVTALILLWCLSAFGILEWFGVSASVTSILARLSLPLTATGIFTTMTPVKTAIGKGSHIALYGTAFAHFVVQVILVFAAPDATRAASVLAGIVYMLLCVGTLLVSFYSARHTVAETPIYHIAVFAGIGFAVSLVFTIAPFYVARHMICAYFGALLLVGTAYKTRIIGHESVMLRHAQDYRYRAYHDSLTGCRNRTAYAHDIEKLENASPAPRSIGILYFDVNGLKHCNDANGHDAGDRLIISVARALCNLCGRTHIYRVGGDEFVGLFPDIDEKELARLIVALHSAKSGDEALANIAVGCSFGDDRPAKRIGDLQMAAEKEMYIDKRRFAGHGTAQSRHNVCP